MRGIHRLFVLIAMLALGVGYLYGNGLTFQTLADNVPFVQMVIVILIAVYTGYVHIFLHEFGHYVFGKMTGYELVYFQMPNFRYEVKTKQFQKLSTRVPGLMGQCLMKPPIKGNYNEKPYFLYLAGGLIVNFLTAMLFYLGSFILPVPISFTLFALSLPPFLLFLMNIVPLGFTDGSVIREIRKSEVSKKLYFKQLELSALFEEGKTFSEIPEEYFSEVKDGTYGQSRLGEYVLLIAYQRALSELNFERADQLLGAYQEKWHYLSSPYRQMLASELLFCHAIFGRKEAAETLMEQIKAYPVLLGYYNRSQRTQVAYKFFVEMKVKEAKAILVQKSDTIDQNLNEAELALQKTLHDWLGSFMGL
ncbi:hypothetical protein [Jeotgalibaca sp. A127]|uniref:hypothetical protein n=1 Tax=Jeotgalibaca sp. A127 TaxID=3457324 RepID=UPI003FD640C6